MGNWIAKLQRTTWAPNCWRRGWQHSGMQKIPVPRAAILSREQILEPVPSYSHSVQFCAGDDEALAGNLSVWLEEGLRRGDSLLAVTTQQRTEALRRQMGEAGQNAMRHGALAFSDSHETLARFMVNGQPDEDRLNKSVGAMVREAWARDPKNRLSFCSDMVGILWETGQFSAAFRLEKFLNELMTWLGFNIFCAYPIDVFSNEFRIDTIDELMCAHTRVVPVMANEDLEAAINRSMDDILGRRGGEMRLLMRGNFRPSWAAAPRAEAMILWLRTNLPDKADEILSRAKRYYHPLAKSTSGAS